MGFYTHKAKAMLCNCLSVSVSVRICICICMRIYKPCPLAIDLNDGHTLAAQSTHTNEAQAGPRSSRAEPS